MMDVASAAAKTSEGQGRRREIAALARSCQSRVPLMEFDEGKKACAGLRSIKSDGSAP